MIPGDHHYVIQGLSALGQDHDVHVDLPWYAPGRIAEPMTFILQIASAETGAFKRYDVIIQAVTERPATAPADRLHQLEHCSPVSAVSRPPTTRPFAPLLGGLGPAVSALIATSSARVRRARERRRVWPRTPVGRLPTAQREPV